MFPFFKRKYTCRENKIKGTMIKSMKNKQEKNVQKFKNNYCSLFTSVVKKENDLYIRYVV